MTVRRVPEHAREPENLDPPTHPIPLPRPPVDPRTGSWPRAAPAPLSAARSGTRTWRALVVGLPILAVVAVMASAVVVASSTSPAPTAALPASSSAPTGPPAAPGSDPRPSSAGGPDSTDAAPGAAGAGQDGDGGRGALWSRWRRLNELCRGGAGDTTRTMQACDQRRAVQREHFDASTADFLQAWRRADRSALAALTDQRQNRQRGRAIPADLLGFTPTEPAFECRYDVERTGNVGCYISVAEIEPALYIKWDLDNVRGWLATGYAPDV